MRSTLRIRSAGDRVARGLGLFGLILGMALAMPASAQTAAWTVQILRPPGMPVSAGTPVAPPAAGQGAPEYARFGSAVRFVDGRLWIGSPGHEHEGVRSGAVWIRAIPGTGDASPTDPLLPSDRVEGLGFGALIAADAHDPLAAVLARPMNVLTTPVRVSVHSTQTPSADASLIVLSPVDALTDVGLTIDRSIVAVSRRATIAGSFRAQALVYQREAGHPQFDLAQTIEMPTAMDALDIVNGRYVELTGQTNSSRSWLASGRRVYVRSQAGEDFAYSHDLVVPSSGVGGNDVILARHLDRLLLNLTLDQSLLGMFYDFNAPAGWQYGTYGVRAQGHAIDGACQAIAFDDDRLACLRIDADGPYVLIAGPTTWSPPPFWGEFIGSARVPVPASGLGSPISLAIAGPHVAIGWPRTGDEDGIVDAGMVVIMTLEGGIFSSGFE